MLEADLFRVGYEIVRPFARAKEQLRFVCVYPLRGSGHLRCATGFFSLYERGFFPLSKREREKIFFKFPPEEYVLCSGGGAQVSVDFLSFFKRSHDCEYYVSPPYPAEGLRARVAACCYV